MSGRMYCHVITQSLGTLKRADRKQTGRQPPYSLLEQSGENGNGIQATRPKQSTVRNNTTLFITGEMLPISDLSQSENGKN
jgi:hypothetical protein